MEPYSSFSQRAGTSSLPTENCHLPDSQAHASAPRPSNAEVQLWVWRADGNDARRLKTKENWFGASKDAKEVLADPDGRWFNFQVTADDIFLLEKKDLPDHLSSLPCVEVCTTARGVMRELEDAGEAPIRAECLRSYFTVD